MGNDESIPQSTHAAPDEHKPQWTHIVLSLELLDLDLLPVKGDGGVPIRGEALAPVNARGCPHIAQKAHGETKTTITPASLCGASRRRLVLAVLKPAVRKRTRKASKQILHHAKTNRVNPRANNL